MKCTRQVRHYVHSVELFVEVHDVKRHRPVVNVVIGVHIVVLSVPLIVVHFVVPILIL